MTYIIAQDNTFLTHHGIKGQKWGVRRDRGVDMTAKAGSGEVAVLAVAGAAYAALLLASAAANAKDSGKFTQLKNQRVDFKKNDSLAKKMSADDIYNNVVKQVNPGYGAKGTQMNCRRCTFAYEMRRRGYDVKATKSVYATGQTNKGLHKATDNSVRKGAQSMWGQNQIGVGRTLYLNTPQARSEAIFQALAKNPNGARGELGVSWSMGGGHSMAWEIVNNKPIIFDAQNAKTYRDSVSFTSFAGVVHDAAYTRLDNASVDEKFLRKWVENA